jgi:hypothetical protein
VWVADAPVGWVKAALPAATQRSRPDTLNIASLETTSRLLILSAQ